MKRLLQNVLIMTLLMLIFPHVNESYATDNVEEIKTEEMHDSEKFAGGVTPGEKQSSERGVTFDAIYEVEKPEKEESNSQNVLSPAEPKDEMIEELTNKDKVVEEALKEELSEAPDPPSKEVEEDVEIEDEDRLADGSEDHNDEKVTDKSSKQPVHDERGKITDEGLTYLDDTVNSVMSKKIVKSPSTKKNDVQKKSLDARNEAFIRDRMTNFLSLHSLNDRKEKAFVRDIVVESIIVKYTSATKLPL